MKKKARHYKNKYQKAKQMKKYRKRRGSEESKNIRGGNMIKVRQRKQ